MCLFATHHHRPALGQIFTVARNQMEAYAWRICDRRGASHCAAEAVQNTLLTLVSKSSQYECPRPFVPWMRVILRRECANVLRGQAHFSRRHVHLFSRGSDDEDGSRTNPFREPTSPPHEQPEARAIRAEETRRLEAALCHFTERDRNICLAHLRGDTNGEIAATENVSPAFVAKRIHRVKIRLRKQLG
jgi:RNA polymerase sigma factor (sigma-70 family)